MHHRRYQIFISSTFEDLRDERRAVQDVVISTGDFPVQMESFPAVDEDQFDFIKSLIDQCDYYVLIIAGRYGSPAVDGISYTHKEYRYAVSKGIPILVMLHGARGEIATAKAEQSDSGKAQLENFIRETQEGRLRKTWRTIDELKLAVREALDHAKLTKPRIGWVRSDAAADVETLKELNDLRKKNEKMSLLLDNSDIDLALPALPKLDSMIDIKLIPVLGRSRYSAPQIGSHATVRSTWISLFSYFFNHLKWRSDDHNGEEYYYIEDEDSCISIGSAIAEEVSGRRVEKLFKISDATLIKLKNYYIEVGLVNTQGGSCFTEFAEKVARRFNISSESLTGFEIIEGEIKVSAGGELDDEVPF